jgi:signal transduction histidine kinase
MAVIAISDDGPGFPPDLLPEAFQRFRRGDVARARQDGGSGLGLAIVQAIARAHGGWADAANRPDGGATVRLAIPVHGSDAGAPRRPSAAADESPAFESAAPATADLTELRGPLP